MKIRAVIRFGFSGLAALSVCLSSPAQDKAAAQNKPVVVPTLREAQTGDFDPYSAR